MFSDIVHEFVRKMSKGQKDSSKETKKKSSDKDESSPKSTIQSNEPATIHMVAIVRLSDKTVVATYAASGITKDIKFSTKEAIRGILTENEGIIKGKRYTSQGDKQSINYSLDPQGRVYVIVTTHKYPARLAFVALDMIKDMFKSDYGLKVASATEESLTKTCKDQLGAIVDKYIDPAKADKLSSVQEKIEVVKTVMHDNIKQVLANTEKLDNIEDKSQQILQQSVAFKRDSKALRDKMWWNMVKMRLLIGGIIALAIIIIVCSVTVGSGSTSK